MTKPLERSLSFYSQSAISQLHCKSTALDSQNTPTIEEIITDLQKTPEFCIESCFVVTISHYVFRQNIYSAT